MEKRDSQLEQSDSHYVQSKQEACFARSTQVWLPVNNNTKLAAVISFRLNFSQ